jgi:hypothetical protein
MDKIGPVRPMFKLEEEPPTKTERLITGTNNAGVVIDINENGMEIGAYYSGFQDPDKKYAILREPIVIPWEELEKLRARSKHVKSKTADFDRVESEVDEEYLKTLPVVTMNKRRYYIDPKRRERRAVEKPSEVWKF